MHSASSPWVYLFSRFTSEALLFEALIIFSLCALYSAFWLLRKRKYGVVEHQVPAGVVKYYLNELIVDAEQLRSQLFGLLSGHGIAATPLANLTLGQGAAGLAGAVAGLTAVAGAGAGAADPGAMAALEAKLAAQAKQIEAFMADKARVEQELAAARAAKGGAAAGGDPNALAKLQEKIAQLEGKLSEYSVIEDDLANLKRLQQENAALRAQLAGKGITPAVAAVAAVAAAPEAVAEPAAAAIAIAAPAPQAEAPAPGATLAAETAAAAPAATIAEAPAAGTSAEAGVAATGATAAGKPNTTAAPTPGAPGLGAAVAQAEAGKIGGGFEGLVDQVEQSLKQTQTPDAPAAAGTQLNGPSTTPAPTATIEKSDADLVAEFEKMLNG